MPCLYFFIDEDGKVKRKHKSRKRDGSPKMQSRAPIDDEEDFDRPKNAEDWEETGDLDFERQLELERRRQDLQRQLALMDEEDAAASSSEPEWKGKEKEEDQRKIPIIHSKLHPNPSPSTPDAETPPQIVKKKKKKRLDGEGKKVKVKKDGASPRKKEEPKQKFCDTTVESGPTKQDTPVKKKKPIELYTASSEEEDGSDRTPAQRVPKRLRNVQKTSEQHDQSFQDERKKYDDNQTKHKGDELKSVKEKRRFETTPEDHIDDSRTRRAREPTHDYYPSTEEQDEEGRKSRVRTAGKRLIDPKQISEGNQDDRSHRREEGSRGPRTPSPHHTRDDRYYYDDNQDDSKRKRLPRGSSQSPPRESARDESMQRKETRGGPRTPSDDDGHFSPRPNQDSSRGARYNERERGPPPRIDLRERVSDQADPRYINRGRSNVDPEFERRRPREDDLRGRRPPDGVRNREEEYQKHRDRDDNYPRDTRESREEEYTRHRGEREPIKDDRGKYRDERPDDFPTRSRVRDDIDFSRGRNRDDPHDDGRGRPPPRDMRRIHDGPEGHERDDRGRPRADYDR